MVEYPGFLGMTAPRLRAYRLETVIAEKCEAMVKPGMANTRTKDFYDIFVLARDRSFESLDLVAAVRNTFARRGTMLPQDAPPVA